MFGPQLGDSPNFQPEIGANIHSLDALHVLRRFDYKVLAFGLQDTSKPNLRHDCRSQRLVQFSASLMELD